MATEPSEVSELLARIRRGEPEAETQLTEAVYGELRRLARRYMRGERRDHTLDSGALVNEGILRLGGLNHPDWRDRSDLLRCAARAMRQVLVDHARGRNREKRGGDRQRVPLDSSSMLASQEQPTDLLALDQALNRLAEMDARQVEIVELLYFTGLTQNEAAKALDISPRTVNREWRLARAWLHDEVSRVRM